MTQDEIIRMARQSGLGWVAHKRLERFAALVAANEKKFWMEQIEVECNEAVLAEREACAVAAEQVVPRHTECGNKIAAAIRGRSHAGN